MAQQLDILSNFPSLLTLASGLNEIGFIKWVAEGFAKPLVGMSPTLALILLVGAIAGVLQIMPIDLLEGLGPLQPVLPVARRCEQNWSLP